MEGAGQELTRRAIHFTVSPLEDGLRGDMMEAARTLLSCVTKLLLLADFVDVKKILDIAGDTETSLGHERPQLFLSAPPQADVGKSSCNVRDGA